jgi:hypothetical protein
VTLALVALGVWLLRPRGDDARSGHPTDSDAPARLRYRVPVGQDPAGVISTLRLAGYHVERDQRPTHIQEVVITSATDGALDREQVRAAIERAPIDIEGAPAAPHPVVFADESGPVTDPRRG